MKNKFDLIKEIEFNLQNLENCIFDIENKTGLGYNIGSKEAMISLDKHIGELKSIDKEIYFQLKDEYDQLKNKIDYPEVNSED